MIKTSNVAVLLLSCILLFACEGRDNSDFDSDMLIGVWAYHAGNDTLICERISKLPDAGFGFQFKANGIFVERTISGWCATPPISYSNFDGNWTSKNSIIEITFKYWGGVKYMEWKVLSVDEKYLKYIILKQEDREK